VVLQEQTAPVWVIDRPQLLPGVCSSVGSLRAAPSFRACSPAPEWGPPQAAMWIPAPVRSYIQS